MTQSFPYRSFKLTMQFHTLFHRQSLEADHIIARKYGGATEAGNLALACSLCNKYKGTDLTSIDPDS